MPNLINQKAKYSYAQNGPTDFLVLCEELLRFLQVTKLLEENQYDKSKKA